MKARWLVLIAVLLASPALAQQLSDAILNTPGPRGEGWYGFTDYGFLANALFNLILSAVLGAAIAYHPRHKQTADTLEEIEAGQIYILYAVIGSIIGILVVKYGMGVGFVLFGIGALIRFRTVLRSASLTGRLIFVTLIGLSCGLDLPHVATLVTAFGFGLIFILDARFTYRIEVRALAPEFVPNAAIAYRQVLEQQDFRIISEKKNPEKGRVRFIFRSPKPDEHLNLEAIFDEKIEGGLRGFVDWEID
ncbi:MAG: hypothetical protein GWM87_13950 [Xanthomonadales bacterium]|nr:hypothetical protein [Xanthomonadales bacterium]NIS44203.1 hypothetical protein [Desulfuromonadales bacterium]NIX13915.1 hypothetical protein [Xanthomonadales bacterium]